jgi:hypothetical protein
MKEEIAILLQAGSVLLAAGGCGCGSAGLSRER